MKRVNKTLNDKYSRQGLLSAILNRTSLDIIIDNIVVDDRPEIITEDDKEKIKIIKKIVNKYLSKKETIIFQLIMEFGKGPADLQRILKYNNWWTAQNNITRVMNIIKLFYEYEKLDHEKLEKEIANNFDAEEQLILEHMQDLKTIVNIKLAINSYYEKTQKTVARIMKKLKNSDGILYNYYLFLKEIRRFRRIKD